MKLRLCLFVLLVLSLVFPGSSNAQSQLCFSVPGIQNCIAPDFRAYWEANGGLAVFGYPTSPKIVEQSPGGAFEVQYFERNRLELHPENARPYNVLLGRLGADVLVRQGRNWQAFPKGQQANDCLWFAETQHSVCGPFKAYWEVNGLQDPALSRYGRSLALFGLPLSEPAVETNSSGDSVLTQWFERARFEYHSANSPQNQLQLGLLGNEVRGSVPTQPAPPPAQQPLTGETLYPCKEGLCTINLATTERRVVVPLLFYQDVLYGYAKGPDGRIYYAVGDPRPDGEHAVGYVADADGSNPRVLGRIDGTTNGVGTYEGYGVIGVTLDNQLLVEVKAQAYLLQPQSGSFRAVTPQLNYGASSGHILVPSPNKTQLLYRSTFFRPDTTVFRVSDGSQRSVNLDAYLSIAFWGRDEDHVIAYRFDRPWDDEKSWGEMMTRRVVGYVEVDLRSGQTQPLSFDPAFVPVTTGANGYIILARDNQLAIYNPNTNALQSVDLPGFSMEGDAKPMIRYIQQ